LDSREGSSDAEGDQELIQVDHGGGDERDALKYAADLPTLRCFAIVYPANTEKRWLLCQLVATRGVAPAGGRPAGGLRSLEDPGRALGRRHPTSIGVTAGRKCD
jgi:hypothetical protein